MRFPFFKHVLPEEACGCPSPVLKINSAIFQKAACSQWSLVTVPTPCLAESEGHVDEVWTAGSHTGKRGGACLWEVGGNLLMNASGSLVGGLTRSRDHGAVSEGGRGAAHT